MPTSISTKLSPLTKQDSDFYAKTISQNNFKADTKFCSLAKLACSDTVSPKGRPLYDTVSPKGRPLYDTVSPKGRPLYDTVSPKGRPLYDTVSSKGRPLYDQLEKVDEATTSLDDVDPFYYFRTSNLNEGDTIHISSTLKQSLPYRAFLPPQIASKLSLTPKFVTNLFPDSYKDGVETTLSHCNAAATKGEIKACLKSLEEMISFSKSALGASKLLALTSKNTEGSDKVLLMEKVKQFNVEKFVACHELFLPFATYYCHSLLSSRVYAVDLVEPETRAPVNTALAVCHMDTSSWPESNVAFKLLKFGPGQGDACHWMNGIDLVWIGDGDNM